MSFLIRKIIFLFIIYSSLHGQNAELRGTWVAWAGSNVPSKIEIATWMDSIAANNMNTVYVDVWRFGFPYFKSDLFYNITGLYTDPNIDNGRDVLQEMIVEAHRVGLNVEAWFEYGFVAGQGANDHIFQVYPDWLAMKKNGSTLFDNDFKWISHVHPEGQQFLIDLAQEVALKYDVDGIEMDRIRYPELDCGYDSVTKAIYRDEHNGNDPPNNIYDLSWKNWRRDKLTEFVQIFYDSLKVTNPNLFISNAPIIYSYGYDNFCQDWRPWINNNYLDFISVQLYRSSHSLYVTLLDQQISYVNDISKFYPGITANIDSYQLPSSEIIKKIKTTRNRGLPGHVMWYHQTVLDNLKDMKDSLYQTPVLVPGRTNDWRKPAIIVNEDDPAVQKTAGWLSISGPGYQTFDGGCYYTDNSGDEWIDYYANVQSAGWYEVYTFNVQHWNASVNAPFYIYDSSGVDTVYVNQQKSGHARWYKVGDYYLNQGSGQKVVRLTNEAIGGNLVFADAIMILNTNRLESTLTNINRSKNYVIKDFGLVNVFPNPFNGETNITFDLNKISDLEINIYNLLGQKITKWARKKYSTGKHKIVWSAHHFSSGVYFYEIKSEKQRNTGKLIYLK